MTKKNHTTRGLFEIDLPDKFIEVEDGVYVPKQVLDKARTDLK